MEAPRRDVIKSTIKILLDFARAIFGLRPSRFKFAIFATSIGIYLFFYLNVMDFLFASRGTHGRR